MVYLRIPLCLRLRDGTDSSLFIGGGVSDVSREPVGRHGHWGKHGKWHDDTTYGISLDGAETVEIVESTAGQ